MFRLMMMAGIGGFVGSCGRFLVGRLCSEYFKGAFPLGTFLVNVVGCFMIGLLFGMLEKHNLLNATESALLITGFCGGFTTFSTFANDMWVMGTKGEWITCVLYLIATVVVGMLLLWLGRSIIR